MKKTCTRCNEEQDISCFGKHNQCRDGLYPICRSCRKPVSAAQRAATPKKWLMYYAARHRAIKYRVPFTLTKEDIVIPSHCPVLGIPLISGGRTDNSPSLDRLVPELGYTKENCRVISNKANRIKSNATAEELLAIYNYTKCEIS